MVQGRGEKESNSRRGERFGVAVEKERKTRLSHFFLLRRYGKKEGNGDVILGIKKEEGRGEGLPWRSLLISCRGEKEGEKARGPIIFLPAM